MSKKESFVNNVIEPEVEVVETLKTGTVVNCDALRVRAKNSTEADVLEHVLAGSVVTIKNDMPSNGFYEVVTESGTNGWCSTAYIKLN